MGSSFPARSDGRNETVPQSKDFVRGDAISYVDLLPSWSVRRPRDGRGGHAEPPGDLGQRGLERGDQLHGQGGTQRQDPIMSVLLIGSGIAQLVIGDPSGVISILGGSSFIALGTSGLVSQAVGQARDARDATPEPLCFCPYPDAP